MAQIAQRKEARDIEAARKLARSSKRRCGKNLSYLGNLWFQFGFSRLISRMVCVIRQLNVVLTWLKGVFVSIQGPLTRKKLLAVPMATAPGFAAPTSVHTVDAPVSAGVFWSVPPGIVHEMVRLLPDLDKLSLKTIPASYSSAPMST